MAYTIKTKDEVFGHFKKFHTLIERETWKKLKCLRMDNGGEYASNAFEEYCRKPGIRHEKATPHTPQQIPLPNAWTEPF